MLVLLPLANIIQAQNSSITTDGLKKMTFSIDPLKLQIKKLKEGSIFSSPQIQVEIENSSANAETYNPRNLTLINEDKTQINVLGIPTKGGTNRDFVPADPVNILPGAHHKASYILNGKIHLPARLVYGDKELALITK